MLNINFTTLAKAYIDRTGSQPFDMIGFVFEGLSEHNEAPAREQLDRSYQHGGGWRPFSKEWRLVQKPENMDATKLLYPGDPPLRLIAWVDIRNERVMLFESSFVCIAQNDGQFEVARMD